MYSKLCMEHKRYVRGTHNWQPVRSRICESIWGKQVYIGSIHWTKMSEFSLYLCATSDNCEPININNRKPTIFTICPQNVQIVHKSLSARMKYQTLRWHVFEWMFTVPRCGPCWTKLWIVSLYYHGWCNCRRNLVWSCDEGKYKTLYGAVKIRKRRMKKSSL